MSVKKFDLNIEKILEDWEVHHAIREVIANAIDEQLLTKTKDIEIFKDSKDETMRLLLLESLLRAKRTFLEFITGEYLNDGSLRCNLCGRIFKRMGITSHLARAHSEIWKNIRPYTDDIGKHLRQKDETGFHRKSGNVSYWRDTQRFLVNTTSC